jgi:hypothetical protein
MAFFDRFTRDYRKVLESGDLSSFKARASLPAAEGYVKAIGPQVDVLGPTVVLQRGDGQTAERVDAILSRLR